MARTKPLPERTPDEVLAAFPFHRQSTLANASTCMLASKWALEAMHSAGSVTDVASSAWNTEEQARGILAHRHAAEVMGTLAATGERSMPVAESLEVMYEVCAQRNVPDADVVYVGPREQRMLRMWAILLVFNTKTRQLRTWSMDKLMHTEEGPAIERRLWAEVPVQMPDGSVAQRVITGQPDALVADPPDGIVIIDFKTTPSAPAEAPESKRDDRGDVVGDDAPGNISYLGYFQQRVYGLLALTRFPNAGRATLREVYPMDSRGMQVRSATVLRADLEHIERELGTTIELLDRALAGGSKSAMWKPKPNMLCSHCPRPGSCPIPREERRVGAIESLTMAERYGEQWLQGKGVVEHRITALKAFHEASGLPIPVRDGKRKMELRWGTLPGGGRRFQLWALTQDEPAEDLAAVFEGVAERKRAAA
jgi:hypothetical protein